MEELDAMCTLLLFVTCLFRGAFFVSLRSKLHLFEKSYNLISTLFEL